MQNAPLATEQEKVNKFVNLRETFRWWTADETQKGNTYSLSEREEFERAWERGRVVRGDGGRPPLPGIYWASMWILDSAISKSCCLLLGVVWVSLPAKGASRGARSWRNNRIHGIILALFVRVRFQFLSLIYISSIIITSSGRWRPYKDCQKKAATASAEWRKRGPGPPGTIIILDQSIYKWRWGGGMYI